ncbi:cobyrinic acid a,c-diamide synthase [Cryptosporangium phraense]|uniref:Cobyrinic acid a,c-diamide synthase n=1 Tax=Cryptosporangium phraense TaxID=2593070 RepID=A0A545AF49_9ACTN|nr:cobyrinic acid a,c-diamide synthase [Cryptosporangium phraense]TQS39890.1 cobyrinic acid a,c-diamide synthase [Cryptosporangium phraense]
MRRRVQLPGASELFRMTTSTGASTVEVIGGTPTAAPRPAPSRSVRPDDRPAEVTPIRASPRAPSGRQRHDEKITVYLSSGELLELERTRLDLRARHGIGIDRGRIVREAIAIALAEYDQNGEHSLLVRRLASGH